MIPEIAVRILAKVRHFIALQKCRQASARTQPHIKKTPGALSLEKKSGQSVKLNTHLHKTRRLSLPYLIVPLLWIVTVSFTYPVAINLV